MYIELKFELVNDYNKYWWSNSKKGGELGIRALGIRAKFGPVSNFKPAAAVKKKHRVELSHPKKPQCLRNTSNMNINYVSCSVGYVKMVLQRMELHGITGNIIKTCRFGCVKILSNTVITLMCTQRRNFNIRRQ